MVEARSIQDRRWRGQSLPATGRGDSGSGSRLAPEDIAGIPPACGGMQGDGGGVPVKKAVAVRVMDEMMGQQAGRLKPDRRRPSRRAARWRTVAAMRRFRPGEPAAAVPVDDVDMGVDLELAGAGLASARGVKVEGRCSQGRGARPHRRCESGSRAAPGRAGACPEKARQQVPAFRQFGKDRRDGAGGAEFGLLCRRVSWLAWEARAEGPQAAAATSANSASDLSGCRGITARHSGSGGYPGSRAMPTSRSSAGVVATASSSRHQSVTLAPGPRPNSAAPISRPRQAFMRCSRW